MESIIEYALIQPLNSSLWNKIKLMINRLPSWIFIALGLVLMGVALFPLLRAALGIDDQIQMQFFTVVMMLIAGVMCGLSGMILMVRRQPKIKWHADVNIDSNRENKGYVLVHASGFLLFTGIPLANFLTCYFIWIRTRHNSFESDTHGREAVCQQISFYLYGMLCLFMSLLLIGVFALLALMLMHLVFTILACLKANQGELFRYPINISIIDRHFPDTSKEQDD